MRPARLTPLHILQRKLPVWLVAIAAGACGTEPTAPERDVRLSIDGVDTIRFGAVASSVQLSATVIVSEGIQPPVDWRSNARSVATVSETGLIVSVGDGTALIVASAEQTSDTVTVVVSQIPVGLRFDVQPTNTAVGVPFHFPVTVSVIDSNGFQVTGATDPIDVALGQNPSGATLLGDRQSNTVRGVAQFSDLSLDGAGSGFTLQTTMGAFSSASVSFDVVAAPDVVNFRNVGGRTVGALIDGDNNAFVNDYAVFTTDSVANVVMANATRGDEIIAFVEGRPPEIKTDPIWSQGVDTVEVTFRDTLKISVTAWIIAGPFETLRSRAISQAATTQAVWAAEGMGLAFDEFEIVDATTDPEAGQFQNTTRCDQRVAARSSIGVRLDRINVYYVGVVDNGRDRGYSCGDVIFMADRSGHELLVHEIGHSFGLGHIDNAPGYDRTNVMHSASSVRAYLTEGQIFRQHFDMASALSVLYSFEPEGLRRCGHSAVSDRCMELITRLWADGTFPPNK